MSDFGIFGSKRFIKALFLRRPWYAMNSPSERCFFEMANVISCFFTEDLAKDDASM